MATNNALSNKSSELTLDPGASGDSFIQFDINATGEFRIGVDDTDGDAFKISQGSALGTNDCVVIDSAGIVTLPLQSSGVNTINSEASVTGDGTDHAVGSVAATTSISDRNSDMTEGDGAGTGAIFTAPATGLYLLNMAIFFNGNPVDDVIMFLPTSNRTYRLINSPMRGRVTSFHGEGGRLGFAGCVIADMDASDTTTFHYQGNSGTKNSTLAGTVISAYLVA